MNKTRNQKNAYLKLEQHISKNKTTHTGKQNKHTNEENNINLKVEQHIHKIRTTHI